MNLKLKVTSVLVFFLLQFANGQDPIVLNLSSNEVATISGGDVLTVTTPSDSISYSINENSLALKSVNSVLNCQARINSLAKDVCRQKIPKIATDVKNVADTTWKCANNKTDSLFYPLVDEYIEKINTTELRSLLKKNKIETRVNAYIKCLSDMNNLVRFSPGSISCIDSYNFSNSCDAKTSKIVMSTVDEKDQSTGYLAQLNTLCGLPRKLSNDPKILQILLKPVPGVKGFIENSMIADLSADKVNSKSTNISENVACQGCGKLAQQIQQTSDPGIRGQLIQQLGTRLRPALATAFGSSTAYAGSRSAVSTGSSTSNLGGSSSARPRLPASYSGSRQNTFSNTDASGVESIAGTDSGLGISAGSSTTGIGGQNVETSSSRTSDSLTRSGESAGTGGPAGGSGGSAGITGSSLAGGSGVNSTGTAPPSDTFLGGNLTAQQQGIKARLTAAPSTDRARLVQTRQMISELANNGVQVRFSYKTDTYGVPKTGSPEIIWIIDRQGKITEYNPN